MFIRDEPKDENGNKINFLIVSIGIDYGASQSKTTFKATGITPLFKQVWTIDEMTLTGVHTPEDIYKRFEEFYKRIVDRYGKVTHAYGDYGALGEVLTYGLNRYLQQHGIPLKVDDCIKGQIIDRIELDLHLMAQNRRFIMKDCKYMIDAYKGAVWEDGKENVRLDDGTSDIDSLDAFEYSIFPFYDKLMFNIK